MPSVWDQTTERGRSSRVDAFLAHAVAHSVSSDVAFGVHDSRAGLVAVAINSSHHKLSEVRRETIARNFGDIILLGICSHEIFRGVVQQGVAPKSEGAPLTPREQQCLLFAARGPTSATLLHGLQLLNVPWNFILPEFVSSWPQPTGKKQSPRRWPWALFFPNRVGSPSPGDWGPD